MIYTILCIVSLSVLVIIIMSCRVDYPQNSDPLYTEVLDTKTDSEIDTQLVNFNTCHMGIDLVLIEHV